MIIEKQTFLNEASKIGLGDVDKEGLAYPKLKESLPQLIFKFIHGGRKDCCATCADHSQLPVAGTHHTCMLSTTQSAPTDVEWKAAEELVGKKKIVQAVLLLSGKVGLKQVVDLDVTKYLEENRVAFQSAVKGIMEGTTRFEPCIIKAFI